MIFRIIINSNVFLSELVSEQASESSEPQQSPLRFERGDIMYRDARPIGIFENPAFYQYPSENGNLKNKIQFGKNISRLII